MEIRQMIQDVARAKNDLAGLVLDGVTPQRLKRCTSAVADLETGVSEILGTAWIPQTVSELTAAIYCVNENLRRLQSDVEDALDVVIERALPDEFFRVSTAMSMGRLLEYQLDVLMNALALATPKTKWTN